MNNDKMSIDRAILKTFVNHPIAQAHSLTGRECKVLLNDLRFGEIMKQRDMAIEALKNCRGYDLDVNEIIDKTLANMRKVNNE